MDQQELDRFMHHYHLSPDSTRVPEALCCAIEIGYAAAENCAWYFFARIAEDNIWLLRKYEDIFRETLPGRPFLLRILGQSGDSQTLQFLQDCIDDANYSSSRNDIQLVVHDWAPGRTRPLQSVITSPYHLDLLWCEFLATGEVQAILAVIATLERPDRVRTRLNDYFRSAESGGIFGGWKKKRLVKKLTDAGILIDDYDWEIHSPQDLDCYCLMDGGRIDRDKLTRFRGILPFKISDDDLNQMAIKATAKWSLCANGQNHALVLQTCEIESAKRIGHCRLSLLEIASYISCAADDMASAFNRLSEALTPDPNGRQRQMECAQAELLALSLLTADTAAKSTQVLQGNVSEIRKKCVDATTSVSAYRAELSLRSNNGVDQNTPVGDVFFSLELLKPNRYRVTQIINTDYDEWVTVCGKTFRAPAWTEWTTNESKLTELLEVNRYLALLQYVEPISAKNCESEQAPYLVLIYDDAVNQYLPDFPGSVPTVEKAFVWIDLRTHCLVKVEFQLHIDKPDSTAEAANFLHCFTSYNTPFTIVPPAFQLIHPTG